MYTLGLDIGSTSSKGVILKNGCEIISTEVIPLGTGTSGPMKVIEKLFQNSKLSREEIKKIIVTGYGRMKFSDCDRQISELSCHCKGVYFLVPNVRTIIDIGGQDAKALKIGENGQLMNFVMNDKCAAGTGRFMDVMAKILDVNINDLGKLSDLSKNEASISSTCTVFAESEVISHLSNEIPLEDIIAGIHNSVAQRVSSLAKRVGVNSEVVMVGGVAKNSGIVKSMAKILNINITVPELAQLTGALGAAIYAYEDIIKEGKNE